MLKPAIFKPAMLKSAMRKPVTWLLPVAEKIGSSPHWERLMLRMQSMSDRERRIVFGALLFAVAALVYLLVWVPVMEWSGRQRDEFLYQQSVYQWVDDHIDQAIEMEKKQQSGHGTKDLSMVASSTARQRGLTLGRVQPDYRGVGVWIEEGAYQKVLAWMVAMNGSHGVVVDQIRIDQTDVPGRIKAYLHLSY